MKAVYSPLHLLHDPEHEMEASRLQAPFENGRRAEVIRQALEGDPQFELVEPTPWGTAPVEVVHAPGLVRFLESAWAEYQAEFGPTREVIPDVFYNQRLRQGMSPGVEPASVGGRLGWWCYETTTPLVEGTFAAACAAADTALTATQYVLDGDDASYGLCRPPGHHASTFLYGGYCYFNNAAISAHHAAATTGGKVTVLDVDYHHGNGTQQIFYERADVQYVSLHGDPVRAYPYTLGYADEVGAGAGRGTNLNVPLAAKTDDESYLAHLATALEAIDAFDPTLLVVSLGLDTFLTDPICDLALTTDGFQACGRLVGELGRPTVVVQEGGYDIDALGENARRWLLGLAGA